jgi:hypothetical protein
MAIDPIRRAEIGREKWPRTRAQLVAAASALFTRQAVESVTVDDVVRESGVAKGTFYVFSRTCRNWRLRWLTIWSRRSTIRCNRSGSQSMTRRSHQWAQRFRGLSRSTAERKSVDRC